MKKRERLSLLINIYLVVSTVAAAINCIAYGAGDGQLGENMSGLGCLKAFTLDSNIWMGICALIAAIFLLQDMSGRKRTDEKLVDRLYLTGTAAVTITFLTVLFFLAPMMAMRSGIKGFFTSYAGFMFFFHFLNPIAAVAGLLIHKSEYKYTTKDCVIAMLPVVLYSIIYLINVVFLGTWSDFYGFTFGGHNAVVPLVLLVMYAVTFAVGKVLSRLRNELQR